MKHEIHGKTRYCPYCPYYSTKSSTLSMHMSMKHDVSKLRHDCRWCPVTFGTQTQLNHHVINRHTEATIPCRIPTCPLLFKNSATYKVHYMRKHMNNIPLFRNVRDSRDVTCNECHVITSASAIYYHVAGCSLMSPFCLKVGSPEEPIEIEPVAIEPTEIEPVAIEPNEIEPILTEFETSLLTAEPPTGKSFDNNCFLPVEEDSDDEFVDLDGIIKGLFS